MIIINNIVLFNLVNHFPEVVQSALRHIMPIDADIPSPEELRHYSTIGHWVLNAHPHVILMGVCRNTAGIRITDT